MGAVFHHYKQILQITKEDDEVNEDYIKEDLISLLEIKPEGKFCFIDIVKSDMVSCILFTRR
jgi:hypothetical protein